jgi:hypothetical protein
MPPQNREEKRGPARSTERKKSATPKKVMRRRASDNAYFHKDFHGALNQALIYIEKNFGAGAVREYLREFARTYFSPLTAELQARGLEALRSYFTELYAREGADIRLDGSPDELIVTVGACPGVSHIRKMGLAVSPSFVETASTLHAAVCEGTNFEYELLAYDPVTGRSVERFFRRRP